MQDSNKTVTSGRQNYMPSHTIPAPRPLASLESKVATNPSEVVDEIRTQKQGGRIDLEMQAEQVKLNQSVKTDD